MTTLTACPTCADKHPDRPADIATCGGCGAEWCDRCDPTAVSALCHYCHGRGYSTAEIAAPWPCPDCGRGLGSRYHEAACDPDGNPEDGPPW